MFDVFFVSSIIANMSLSLGSIGSEEMNRFEAQILSRPEDLDIISFQSNKQGKGTCQFA